MFKKVLCLLKSHGVLFLIFTLASGLRLMWLTVPDSYTDEAVLALRSIGLMDYTGSYYQTTPWQWFEKIPWWARLSFHDHPLGFFVIEYFFIKLMGVSLWAVRLPSVIFGLGTVFLLYQWGKKIVSKKFGLIASGLLAVSSYHIWVSRLGIQDGAVTMMIVLLLCILGTVKEKPVHWYWWGMLFGLSLLLKYTALISFGFMLWYLVVYQYSAYRRHEFWGGMGLACLVTAPQWLYNFFLYRARGHFDFQISAALGQEVPEWSIRVGRELTGDIGLRIQNFFTALHDTTSPLFWMVVVFACAYAGYRAWGTDRLPRLLVGYTIIMSLWFLILGSTYRFVVMIVPLLTMLITWTFYDIFLRNNQAYRWCMWTGLGFFMIMELLFSFNTFSLQPVGTVGKTYAAIRSEGEHYGFNALDRFLTERLKKEENIVIIYDHDINFLARLWVLDRHAWYGGVPLVAHDDILKNFKDNLISYQKKGIQSVLYVVTARSEVRKPIGERLGTAEVLVHQFIKEGSQVTDIHNRRGELVFRVYDFAIQ